MLCLLSTLESGEFEKFEKIEKFEKSEFAPAPAYVIAHDKH